MSKIICPKCDYAIDFDASSYKEGQSLVFECEHCRKSFTIRIGENDEDIETEDFGHIVVIENTFCYKQIIPLHEGDNMFGRYNKGTVISNPIETNDPSMDRRHCIINVKRGYSGDLTYTIRDNQSVTGTFVMNRILGNRERLLIEDGAIITLGATTLILHTPDGEE
ncbi:MAG: FHA domain-containing protein [Bacteroidaceae bacterium]|nr:FHA domain-containing protein [Bacteroidaceae bacterium]